MKTNTIFVLYFLFITSLFAQKDPKGYLSRIPAIPDSPCSMTSDEMNKYLTALDDLAEEIQNQIDTLKQLAMENTTQAEEAYTKKAAKDAGLSEADMKKLASDDISDEEKEAIVNKVLENKTNISSDEIKNLDAMSEKGQEAWAKAMMEEKMADAQNNKDAIAKENKKNMNTANLAKDYNTAIQKVNARSQKFMSKRKELDDEEIPERAKMDKAIEPLCKEWWSLVGIGNGQTDSKKEAISKKVKELRQKHWEKFTPKILALIQDEMNQLPAFLTDVKQMEELGIKLNQSTLQTGKDIMPAGVMQLQTIKDHVLLHKDAYKYYSQGDCQGIVNDENSK
jgi:hypothetical protein